MIRVVAGIYISNDYIYICQRPKEGILPNYWEFPGGKVEAGETDEEALIREMKEECNVDVSVGELVDDTVYHYDDFSIELVCYFIEIIAGKLTSNIHQDEKKITSSELKHIDFAPADINAVNKLIKLFTTKG